MAGVTDIWMFVLAGLLVNVTPGPDMAVIMARSAQLGWRGGAASALGVGGGCFVHILAATLGLSAVIATSATAFTVLKLAGALYLVALGVWILWRSLRNTSGKAATATLRDDRPASPSLSAVFWQGFITNVLNPKVAIFFLAFVPQFISTDTPDKAWTFALLGLIFNINGTIWNLAVALVSARAARTAHASASFRKWIDCALGGLFVILGARLAVFDRAP